MENTRGSGEEQGQDLNGKLREKNRREEGKHVRQYRSGVELGKRSF